MSSRDPKGKFGSQSWVQLEGLFQPILVRKLRQINDSLLGYDQKVGSSTGVLPLYFVQVLCRNLLDTTIWHFLPY
jgi:hypothetical protein